jgi:hypothetical protein
MDALESPGEESCSVRGSVACGEGKVPKKVKGVTGKNMNIDKNGGFMNTRIQNEKG